ncbi:hypothetical protein MOI08_004608 [Salmonella enterica subsp. enterica serovar Muenchen]|nr:hypothetical protein [Salmonella enterica subsp. enterica serovar Muenchen]
MLRSNIIDAASSVEDLIAKLGGTGRGLREKTNSISHLLERTTAAWRLQIENRPGSSCCCRTPRRICML